MMNDSRLRTVGEYAAILAGATVLAVAYACFLSPFKIVPGGVYGICIVIHHLTAGMFDFLPGGLPIGITALLFNIPLMFLTAKVIGLSSGGKTIASFLMTSLMTDFFTTICNGEPIVKDDMLLSCFYGGALMGVGVALIIRSGGTCAGTDVLAVIASRRTHGSISNYILIIDSAIVLLGLVAFRDLFIPLYSWLTIAIFSFIVGRAFRNNPYKSVFIVTRKPDEVKEVIIGKELKIGGNFIKAEGLYTGEERKIIFAMVKRGKILRLRKAVEAIDKDAFFVVSELSEESYCEG